MTSVYLSLSQSKMETLKMETAERALAEAIENANKLRPRTDLLMRARTLLSCESTIALARAARRTEWPPAPTPQPPSPFRHELLARTQCIESPSAAIAEIAAVIRAAISECVDMHRVAQESVHGGFSSFGERRGLCIFSNVRISTEIKHIIYERDRILTCVPICSISPYGAARATADMFNHAVFSYFMTRSEYPEHRVCCPVQYNVRAAFIRVSKKWIPVVVSDCQFAGSKNLDDVLTGDCDDALRALIILRVLASIAVFHSVCGMAHGDLHASNVLFDKNDHIRIIDFDQANRTRGNEYLKSTNLLHSPLLAEDENDFITHAELYTCGGFADRSLDRKASVRAAGPSNRHVDFIMALNEMPWRSFDHRRRLPLPGIAIRAWFTQSSCPVSHTLRKLAAIIALFNSCLRVDLAVADGESPILGPAFMQPLLFNDSPTFVTWHLASTAAAAAQAVIFPFASQDAALDFLADATPSIEHMPASEALFFAVAHNTLTFISSSVLEHLELIIYTVAARMLVDGVFTRWTTAAASAWRGCPDAELLPITPSLPVDVTNVRDQWISSIHVSDRRRSVVGAIQSISSRTDMKDVVDRFIHGVHSLDDIDVIVKT